MCIMLEWENHLESKCFRFTYDLRAVIRPYIGRSLVHPVFTTMMPKNNKILFERLNEWTIDIKNDFFRGDTGYN